MSWLRRNLYRWYKHNRRSFPWRLNESNNYQKLLSEVLLQRTRAESVARFLPEFLMRYPSWRLINQETKSELKRALSGIGLASQRASRLKNIAKVYVDNDSMFARDRIDLESTKGIGPYLASAILLFNYHQKEPLLDENMARILRRFFGLRSTRDVRFDPPLYDMAKSLVDFNHPIGINWAIMDLGALVCKPRLPICNSCPLNQECAFPRNEESRSPIVSSE